MLTSQFFRRFQSGQILFVYSISAYPHDHDFRRYQEYLSDIFEISELKRNRHDHHLQKSKHDRYETKISLFLTNLRGYDPRVYPNPVAS